MNANRPIVLSLVLAATALMPAAAVAKHGADDNAAAADGHGGLRAGGDDDHADNGGRRDRARHAKKVVRVAGTCTGASTSKLEVKRDRGRLKAEFEVDQNAPGVTWAVTLRRNGAVALSTSATTHAPSGSLRVERRLINGAGPDAIAASATSPTGEVCTATVTA